MRSLLLVCLSTCFFMTSAQSDKKPDIEMLYNGEPINLKEGIQLPAAGDPEILSELGYTIDSLLLSKTDPLFSRMLMTLVRGGKGIVSLRYNELEARKMIDAHEILAAAVPTDHIVIEWKLRGIALNYSPKIMSFQIRAKE